MALLHKSTNFDPGCIWFVLVHHWLLWHKHIKHSGIKSFIWLAIRTMA